ncbi:hypothetical protein T484DRAFT_1877095 [Baffinella frigidus]|nr:hypothetical protein T484DRAFT_1877095 [Cryptophyta sp. CCMP2293]
MSSAASNYCPEEGCKGSPTDLAWGPEGSSDSWLEDDLGLLFSEDGTDWEGDAPEEVTRGQHRVDPRLKKHWENIGSILDGLTPRSNTLGRSSVQPSCVIDFQYYDKPPQNRQGDYLNLADGLLERAYFFRIPRDHGNQLRLALHAHTFVKWSERRNGPLKDPSLRANEITSVNVRIAEKTSVGKKVNGKEKFEFHEAPAGFPMLPRSKDLQKNWRQYFREEGGKQHKDVQWKWTDEEHFPFGEVHLAQDEDQKAYSRIRKLIQIADEFLRNNPPPPETTSPRQTRKKIRGSNSTVQVMPKAESYSGERRVILRPTFYYFSLKSGKVAGNAHKFDFDGKGNRKLRHSIRPAAK